MKKQIKFTLDEKDINQLIISQFGLDPDKTTVRVSHYHASDARETDSTTIIVEGDELATPTEHTSSKIDAIEFPEWPYLSPRKPVYDTKTLAWFINRIGTRIWSIDGKHTSFVIDHADARQYIYLQSNGYRYCDISDKDNYS